MVIYVAESSRKVELEAHPLFEKNAENPFRVRLDSSFFSGTIGLTSKLARDRRKIMEFPVDWRYSRDHRNYGRPSPGIILIIGLI